MHNGEGYRRNIYLYPEKINTGFFFFFFFKRGSFLIRGCRITTPSLRLWE